jgi:hypothetical protein
MKASYTGLNEKLRRAAAFVNRLDTTDTFWDAVRGKPDYDYTRLSSAEVHRRLRTSDGTVRVKLWTPKPGTYVNTIAVTRKSSPWFIYYNTRKLDRLTSSMVNTIVHEFVHSVDYFDDGDSNINMGHGGSSSVGKQDSAPYWIGARAGRLYREAVNLPREFEEEEEYVHEEVEDIDESDIVDEPEVPLRNFDEENAPEEPER